MTISGLGNLPLFINNIKLKKMENNNDKNINVIPHVHYSNADKNKNAIYEENRDKSGIYR
jgi:hypothetical protein